MTVSIKPASPAEYETLTAALAGILVDAVASGAGVSFMKPLAVPDALAYWQGLAPEVASGRTIAFIAETEEEIAGVVLLIRSWSPNQPHRADIAKLLVHRKFRRRGVGTALMTAAEARARDMGLRLITFDAVAHGGAEAFYRRLGFTPAGIIPGYAYSGDGQLDDTMFFYKTL